MKIGLLGRNIQEAEAYWGMILAEYGIEYVKDPSSHRMIPTCHRVNSKPITNTIDFKRACKFADPERKLMYREEAALIDKIQQGILRVSAGEEPYDVFICYKELDDYTGERTYDSVLAQEIYDELERREIRTFFARISLEDKIGRDYEPFIYAALTSAKVLLLVSTSGEHCESVWVKNEWMRFLQFMSEDYGKTIIPVYLDMSPYEFPEELSRYQAQDMGKVGAIQDLVRGITKLLDYDKSKIKTQRENHPIKAVKTVSNDKPPHLNKHLNNKTAISLIVGALAVISVLTVVILYSQGVIKKQYFDLKYRSGNKALEEGKYEQAIESFGGIKEDAPYKTDSVEMAYYKWGEALLSQNLYEEAAEKFEEAGDYEDADEQKNEALYQYIVSVKDNTITQKTKEYCDELISKNYKDIQDIYEYIIEVKAKLVINANEDDLETDITNIDRKQHQKVFIHITTWGGELGRNRNYWLYLWKVNEHRSILQEAFPINYVSEGDLVGNYVCKECQLPDDDNLGITIKSASLLIDRTLKCN